MKLIIDGSALREPTFENFLAASQNNHAIITEVTAFGSCKGDPVTNSARNYRIAARYPQRCRECQECRGALPAIAHWLSCLQPAPSLV